MLETEFHPALEQGSQKLLIMLHGLGDSVAGYRWLPSLLKMPSLNYLLVNAPDSYYGGFSWYDFAGDPAPGISRSRKLLCDLLDEQRKSGFPTELTTLAGFSQGCLMTWEVGLTYPHRFAGLIGISGYIHEPERLMRELSPIARQQRFFVSHGYQDQMIPFAEVRNQVQQMKGAGLNIEWREFAKAHTIAGEEELALIRKFIQAGYTN
ncbi:MAG TPA: serine esterase [Verrucomicrobiae bacterium]